MYHKCVHHILVIHVYYALYLANGGVFKRAGARLAANSRRRALESLSTSRLVQFERDRDASCFAFARLLALGSFVLRSSFGSLHIFGSSIGARHCTICSSSVCWLICTSRVDL